jgi:hypothetical protein
VMDPTPKLESEYRKSRRWLLILLGLLFPVMLLAAKISDIVGSDLVFGVSGTVFMIALICVCIWSYVAYCRWRRKYPFYWLHRK